MITSSNPAADGAYVLQVDDMTCTHCAGTIRNALRDAMPGVPIDIDMEQQQVTIRGDVDKAIAVIREAGYEAKRLGR